MSDKAKHVAVWVVSALLALQYLFAGVPKLLRLDQAVQGFRQAGYPVWFLLFIGAAETSGAVGLFLPRLRFWAASGLGLVMVGALATHIRMRDTVAHMVPAGVSLVLLALIAWAVRPRKPS